jgi:hypothetical protein
MGETRRVIRRSIVPLLLVATLAGCRQNDDPEGAKQLWAKINEEPGFRSWRPAPGFSEPKPSFTAHADVVRIYVNESIATALDGPSAIVEWPVGSIVVKEGFSRDGSLSVVAVMEKRADGWYWAEYDDEGEPLYSGKPRACVDCHDNRRSYSDWVYAFELPR